MNITAIVLAGGRGSRMNYVDKAWLDYKNKPLIQHVIDAVSPSVSDIIISRNSNNEQYELLPYRCVPDIGNNSMGPLSGIAACAAFVKTEYSLIVPCDIPTLPHNLTAKLTEGLRNSDTAIVHDGQRRQNLVFVTRTKQLDSISDFLAEGGRAVHRWLETISYEIVNFSEDPDSFENINTLEQLGK